MKTILSISIVLAFLALVTFSCKKTNNQDEIKTQLSQTQTLLLKSYQGAKSNADSLTLHVGSNGQYTDPRTMMEDSLYHLNDSLFKLHYLTYCKEMMDGDKMMGNNMMNGNSMMAGGNAVHGTGMMANHSTMGDTAKVNQYSRDLNTIRQAHISYHPVKTSDHLLHHQ